MFILSYNNIPSLVDEQVFSIKYPFVTLLSSIPALNKVQLIINAQYDIESIKVGDTCQVLNLAENSGVFTNNMQIVRIIYNWDNVTLDLEEVIDDFGNQLTKFNSHSKLLGSVKCELYRLACLTSRRCYFIQCLVCFPNSYCTKSLETGTSEIIVCLFVCLGFNAWFQHLSGLYPGGQST